MDVIDAALRGVIGKGVEEMADIVSQGRDHKGGTGPGLFGEASRLAGMLPLGDRFAAVCGMSMFGEEDAEGVVGVGHEPSE